MSCRILQGDVLDRLRGLPDESVQCVVTSPPYWGLRDYGTGAWEGGDSNHTHDTAGARGGRGGSGAPGKQTEGSFPSRVALPECSCGAVRVDHQIGLEATPAEFLAKMVAVFREVRRVLRADGTCWVNMGDAYAGSGRGGNTSDTSTLEGTTESQEQSRKARGSTKPTVLHKATIESGAIGRAWVPPPAGLKQKDLIGMPWRLAFALQEDGWWLRQDIIWAKPNPMPESVTDRCTKAHEYIFLLTKSARYFYDAEAVKEAATCDRTRGPALHADLISTNGNAGRCQREGNGTRNKRSVWEIATEAFAEAHFATFPTKLVEPCILAGTSERGCCSSCGAPWERVTQKRVEFASGSGRSGREPEGKHAGGTQEQSGEYDIRMGPVTSTQTLGWKAGCGCGAETVGCTVMDPFNGAGTTGLVARRLGRNYVGIELNPEYAAMAQRRITADAPMFNHVEVHP